jgi:hypothetical protein
MSGLCIADLVEEDQTSVFVVEGNPAFIRLNSCFINGRQAGLSQFIRSCFRDSKLHQ